ncbi:MAG: ABC transporter ATP-binding protein [Alphaproteobacteria bacterium]|nr:MAG: ABC transporter ATP-binding protein [Alphaproteobacteria bacterium]
MIRFENVTKTFPTRAGTRVIVENLNLTIRKGRSLAMLGRNGAGKSTIMRMIAGTLDPDSGRIHRHARISWPLGFSGGFHGALTGAQNVRFAARIYGVDTDALLEYVEAFADLGPFMHEPVASYSSGMKGRLAFGVSMGVLFDFYLVDELTAVGDEAFKRKCQAVFDERLQRANVIMISHSMPTLRNFCQSGLVVEGGRVEYFEDLEEAIEVHMENMRKNVA